MKCYVNLTNGIECIQKLGLRDYRFIRIQSTACEQKRWDFIIQDLDYDFLMSLALGENVVVFDTSKREVSRAVWQGLKWIEYVLSRRWLERESTAIVRNHNVTGYFRSMYKELENRTFKKIDYFKKFLNIESVDIGYVCMCTDKDGNYSYFKEVLAGRIIKLREVA